LGFEIFNPEGKKKALQVFGFSSVIYYIALIGWPTSMFETTVGADPLEMLDISLRNVVLVSAMFYIICVIFVLARGFLLLRKRIEGANRARATNLGISFLMFAFAAILDTVMTSEFMVIARIIMALSTIYFYKGFYIKKEAQTPQI
jgi:small-conductance mechanosensitive channel